MAGPVREQPTRVLGEKPWSRLTPPRPSGRPFAATRERRNKLRRKHGTAMRFAKSAELCELKGEFDLTRYLSAQYTCARASYKADSLPISAALFGHHRRHPVCPSS